MKFLLLALTLALPVSPALADRPPAQRSFNGLSPNTLVTIDRRGNQVPLSRIKKDMTILSFNKDQGLSTSKVTRVSSRSIKVPYVVHVRINGEFLKLHPDHQLFISPRTGTDIKWKAASKLQVSDRLFNRFRKPVKITSIVKEKTNSPVEFVEIEVEPDHVFFAGRSAVLVHNFGGTFFANVMVPLLISALRDWLDVMEQQAPGVDHGPLPRI